jgi:hypothetical protein
VRAVVGLLALALPGVLHAERGDLRIEGVEARMYLHDSGTLSAPITPSMTLWNTIIGEGAAAEPSTSTLVDVIVQGTPGSFEAGRSVELVVINSTSGKVTARMNEAVGVISRAGISHIAFWLPDTGCEPLTITASIGRTTKKLDLPFACGE